MIPYNITEMLMQFTHKMKALLALFVLGLVVALPASAGQYGSMASKQNIVQIAAGNPEFSTLVTALKKAGLVKTLEGKGPFTVFAPTNAAFAALPPGTVDNLLKPENRAQLRAILLYHVVPGKVTAAEAMQVHEAKTANGAELPIHSMDGKVMVGDATVTQADIMASNGVIHVIDKVLMPPQG
jgi:uncharacterized surface protein with fasciclin (FAS1) repeats